MSTVELKMMKPSAERGMLGMLAMALIAIGAGILWGIGGCLLAIGLALWVDLSTDEAVERFTGTSRGLK